ncbi:MAG: bifunctional DNA primase/polymerase [Terriglobia bacterium]
MTIDLPQIIIDACAKGFSIIPVRIDKRPFFSWKQYQQKTAPIETLRAWNEKYRPMSWAIVTGKVSDVIVIDCDGENGLETLKQLGNRPHIKTGSGGAHLYIKYPGHPVLTLNGKTKVELGDRYPGTDIRADGGYAIVWGANDSGKYEQLRELIPDTLNSLPEDLRNLLGLNIPPENQNEGLLESHPSKRNGQVSFKLLISRAIVRAKNNGRNNAGFWLACQLRDSGLAVVEAKLAMREYADRVQRTNTKGRVEPYPFREALASLRQAYAKTARRPGNIIDDSKNAERDKSKALPRIDLSIGDLAVLAKRAWSVIESSNNPPRLFRYGGNLVRIELADDQLPVIRELTPDRLRYDLARDAKWGMLGINGEWKAKAPPMHVVRDILATPDPQLPALVGIVETPIIAPDGTLYTVRGYNCKTKTYYWPIAGFSIEPIPEQISSTDIKEAVDYLRTELLGDFPFINEGRNGKCAFTSSFFLRSGTYRWSYAFTFDRETYSGNGRYTPC